MKSKIFLNLLFIIFSAQGLFAQSNSIEVNVTTNAKPQSALGFIMRENSTVQKVADRIEQVNSEQYLVRFSYQPEEVKGGCFASAMILSEEGKIYFGDTKYITSPETARSYLTLPDCAETEVDISGVKDQMGLLESLSEIRSARKEAGKLRITKALNPEILEKLSRLEKGFGLTYNEKLSADLNSFTLVDRLSRIANAVKNYHNRRVN